MGDDRDRRQPLLMDELVDVVDVRRHGVVAVRRPLAVAMPAQVGTDDVPVVTQGLRHPVPVAAVVPPAVDQEQRRRVGVAPIDVVKTQTLGVVVPRGGARHAVQGTHGLTYSPSCRGATSGEYRRQDVLVNNFRYQRSFDARDLLRIRKRKNSHSCQILPCKSSFS